MSDVIHDDRPETATDEVHYAVDKCSLGYVAVAASERGLCAVFLGDSAVTLWRDLHRALPGARLSGGDDAFRADWVAPVVRLINQPSAAERIGLPLAIHGTPLQRRVWNALCEIPAGETRSYGEVAAQLGLDRWSGPRDVAAACAANRLAVVVPCHRVVAADGRLSGYRWGVARKARLLAREKRGALR